MRPDNCNGCTHKSKNQKNPLYKELVIIALKDLADSGHEEYVLQKITLVEEAIVSGIKYYIDFKAVAKNCSKTSCSPASCLAIIIHQEWLPNPINVICVDCN